MGRVCGICRLPEAARTVIDEALVRGEAYRGIAKQYGLPEGSVWRHKAHVRAQMAQAQHTRETRDAAHAETLAREAEERAEREAAHAIDLLEQLRLLQGRTLKILLEAGDDPRLALVAIGKARENIELWGRLTGELTNGAQVNVTQNAVILSPEWARIVRALAPYPEARAAVAAALEGVAVAGPGMNGGGERSALPSRAPENEGLAGGKMSASLRERGRGDGLSRVLIEALRAPAWEGMARPEQLAPEGTWRIWLQLGGRGSGKTRSASEWVTGEVVAGRARHVAVVARASADLRDVCIEGPSGLLAVAPDWFRPSYEPSKRRVVWPNGAQASAYSGDEPDLLRGPQHDLAWVDELAAFEKPEEVWANLMLGLRVGQARAAISTTPRPIPLVRQLVARHGQDVHVTKMTTFENLPNLSPAFAQDIVTRYAGTTLGRQELYAEILTDVPGALWSRELLEKTRVQTPPVKRVQRTDGNWEEILDLVRIVVAVDPSVSATPEGAAECGIVVCALGRERPPHGYVLADLSGHLSPDAWARRVVEACRSWRADRVVAESNQGGQLVDRVLRTLDPNLPLTTVHASRSKEARAEPVAALYEQHRIHHVGLHADLEEQLCSWVPGSGESPDRLDALVWALTSLIIVADQDLTARLKAMTPAEREAYHARQAALAAWLV